VDVPGYFNGWEKAFCWKESIESTSSITLPTIQEGLINLLGKKGIITKAESLKEIKTLRDREKG
jgi:hypothetical protein